MIAPSIAAPGGYHSLSDNLQFAAAMILVPAVCYALVGRLLAAQSPGGKLSWSGRRWQRGITAAVVLWSAGLLIAMLGRAAPLAVTVPLWALLGYGAILAIRWLWRDWKKQQQAREAYFQKLAQEGKTYAPPPLTGANKAWRWVFNGYAIVLVVALVYGLIRYLVGRH
jgi:hypothetical protein